MAVLIWAAGCATPISNAPFTDEAEFLAALPEEASWAAPTDVLRSPRGADGVLLATLAAGARWEGWVEGPVVLGEALRSREPDERTDVARRWRRREVNANYTGASLRTDEPRRLFVEAEVVLLEDGAFRSVIGVAPTEDGPWVEVSTATRDGDQLEATWHLDDLFAAHGVDERPGDLILELTDGPEDWRRELVATVGVGAASTDWRLRSEDLLGFSAPLQVTADGLEWPAAVDVTVVPGQGGVATGVVFTTDGTLGFTACWDAAGDPVFRGGDAGVATTGGAGACVDAPR